MITDSQWRTLSATEKQRLQDEAAVCTNQTNTQRKPVGDAVDDAFKLTKQERTSIKLAIEVRWPVRVDNAELEELTDRIESIINLGWQTC